jgi:DNA-binding NarL/FixJ family response regulator
VLPNQMEIPPLRILIADDNEMIRKAVRTILETCPGVTVCGEAVDGIDAANKAAQTKPDVVLLDWFMPRMGGADALQLIQAQIPQARVIILTESDAATGRILAEKMNVSGFVIKSEARRDLIPAIESVRDK